MSGFSPAKTRAVRGATALPPWPVWLGPATRFQTARGGTQGPLKVKRTLPHYKQPGAGPKNPGQATACGRLVCTLPLGLLFPG